MEDIELIEAARRVVKPRRLSPSAEAGSVGSALLTERGSLYLGVCIDTACGMGFCAEHNAVGSMITDGESRILTIVAVNRDGRPIAPCGRCREFILQVNSGNAATRVLLTERVATIGELLPERWS